MKRNVTLAFAVFAAVAASSAFATNGYFSHGYSVKEKGLAGAGVAMPQDAMASSTNPAGVVMVGQRMDLGAVWFHPERSYSVDANGGFWGMAGGTAESVDSHKEDFLIPNFGAVWMLNPNSALGLAIYGNGGMNTTYPGSAQGGAGTFFGAASGGNAKAGVDLMQLLTNLSYSQKITPTSSWGASVIFAYQRFKATGLAAFAGFSNDSDHLTDKGNDSSTGFGAKLGWTGEVSPGLSLGASYQTKISMGEFDKYKGLFAENGDFDIPSTWTVGLAYKITPSSSFLLDVQRINYTDIKSVSDRETNQPIRESDLMFNILVPAVMEQHLTFGFTNKMNKNSELTLSAMYAPEKKVSGTDQLMGENIQIKMKEYEVGVNYGWKF